MPVPESSSALPVYSPIPSLEKPPHDPYRADAGERLSQHDSEESENDPFLFDGFRVPLRRHLHWLQRYGRLGAEVLLVLLNLCLLAYLVFKPQVPLLLRQKECGRLLGQWCKRFPYIYTDIYICRPFLLIFYLSWCSTWLGRRR